MLTAVISIITGAIVFSPIFVYVSIIEYINNNTKVIIPDIAIP